MAASPLAPVVMAAAPPAVLVAIAVVVVAVASGAVAAVLALPAVLLTVALVLAPLAVLAVVLAADPADQRAADRAQPWEDQVANQPAARGAQERVRLRRPRVLRRPSCPLLVLPSVPLRV